MQNNFSALYNRQEHDELIKMTKLANVRVRKFRTNRKIWAEMRDFNMYIWKNKTRKVTVRKRSVINNRKESVGRVWRRERRKKQSTDITDVVKVNQRNGRRKLKKRRMHGGKRENIQRQMYASFMIKQ